MYGRNTRIVDGMLIALQVCFLEIADMHVHINYHVSMNGKPPTAQDPLSPIPGFISCTRVTGHDCTLSIPHLLVTPVKLIEAWYWSICVLCSGWLVTSWTAFYHWWREQEGYSKINARLDEECLQWFGQHRFTLPNEMEITSIFPPVVHTPAITGTYVSLMVHGQCTLCLKNFHYHSFQFVHCGELYSRS